MSVNVSTGTLHALTMMRNRIVQSRRKSPWSRKKRHDKASKLNLKQVLLGVGLEPLDASTEKEDKTTKNEILFQKMTI